MPENRQAEDGPKANSLTWPWRRLMAGSSAILALLLSGLFLLSASRGFDPVSDPAWEPPSLIYYPVFALLLFGAIAALWRKENRFLAVGWLALLAALLIDAWQVWRVHPEFLRFGMPWSDILTFCVIFAGFGLAVPGWPSRRIERMNESAK